MSPKRNAFVFLGQSDAVGFYAYVNEHTILTEGSILIFDNIVTNIGDAYSDVTGTFTGVQCIPKLYIQRQKIHHSK